MSARKYVLWRIAVGLVLFAVGLTLGILRAVIGQVYNVDGLFVAAAVFIAMAAYILGKAIDQLNGD